MDSLTTALTPFGDWLIEALKSTTLSAWMRNIPWLWPLCETLHFIGLSMILGVIGTLDCRLMGFMSRIPLVTLRALLPFGLIGFAINVVTGIGFFIGAPQQYVYNVAWWWKVLFLIVAGANALYFETTQGKRALTFPPNQPTPTAFKVAGAVSLVAWFMVIYWGRMLPFIGNAF